MSWIRHLRTVPAGYPSDAHTLLLAARRLGVSHVRGILLSGPPGCGKTLLARELARSLGAREPQVVNGPEILDKYVGEAEKRVRALFAPAEEEYAAAGDASELHVIILDEMDAIAKKRGTVSSSSCNGGCNGRCNGPG